jgi:hypothetical protein
MVRHIRYGFVLVVLCSLIVSCGGGGSGGGDGDSGTVIAPATTKVIDNTSLQNLVSIVDNGAMLIFSSTSPTLESLAPGDVIVCGVSPQTPYGLLRKVQSVTRSGEQVLVATGSTTLEEAFQKMSFQASKSLTPSDVLSAVSLRPGVSLRPTRPSASQLEGFYFDLNDVILYDEDGNLGTTNDQIKANGSVSINPGYSLSWDIDGFQLKQLTFTNTTTLSSRLEIISEVTLKELNKKFEIPGSRRYFAPITYWVGIYPVVITPIMTVNVGIKGDVTVGITTSVTTEATLTAGGSYNNGQWSLIHEYTTGFQWDPPTLTAGASAKGFAGPQMNLLLYGVSGPYGEVRGFLEFIVDILANPWWEFYGGLEADVGFRVEILSRRITDFEYPAAIGYRLLLAQAPGYIVRDGIISGLVLDAVAGTPLAGASISVLKQGAVAASGTTNTAGTYSVQVLAGSGYSVAISKPGYIPSNYENVSVTGDDAIYLETVLQIDVAHSGPGDVSGTIVNALSGTGVEGLSVQLRPGINVTTGTVVAGTATLSNGSYSFSNLNAGQYTAQVGRTGYNTTYFTIVSIGGTTTGNQNATITPILSTQETRIILTWGFTPADLDSHMTGPLPDGTRFHMFFPYAEANLGSPWPTYVKLDLDDTMNYGPETTTIYQQVPGTYRFSVHDYTNLFSTNSYALSGSGAQVRVYQGSNLVASFNVPANQAATLWTVFEMNGTTITPINTMSNVSDPDQVLSPSRAGSAGEDATLFWNLPLKR